MLNTFKYLISRRKIVLSIALSFCLAISIQYMQLISAHYSLVFLILVAIWGVFFYRNSIFCLEKDYPIGVVSFIFSMLMILGNALVHDKTINYLFSGDKNIALTLLSAVSLTILFYSVIKWIFDKALGGGALCSRDTIKLASWKILLFIFLVAWMPYLIASLPGSTCPDMRSMLAQFFGYTDFSTHHPLQSTFVYGAVFSVGKFLGGTDNFGVFAIVVFQTITYMIVCSYEVRTISKLNIPKWITVLSILFFALVPIFGSYCQWAVKDSLFGAVFALYATLFALYVKDPIPFMGSRKQMAALLISAFGVGVLRNNGLYVVLLSLPFLALLHKGWRLKLKALIPLILVVILIPVSNACCQTVTHAKSGGIQEVLSIPFQQTARYAKYHSNEIENWEREAIGAVLDYDGLSDLYRWNVSDPVKATYKTDGSLANYFKAWASQGLKHPASYLNATLLQTYGYWYPLQGKQDYEQEFCGFGLTQSDVFNWHTVKMQGFAGDIVKAIGAIPPKTISLAREIPFIGLLMGDGIYFWALLLEAALLVYAGCKRSAILFLPCFILFLTCLAGPLNGSIRYGLGVIVAAPTTFAMTLDIVRGKYSHKND